MALSGAMTTALSGAMTTMTQTFEKMVKDIDSCATKLAFIEGRTMDEAVLMHETVRRFGNELDVFDPGLDETWLLRKVWG